jgi:hypothetical protein
MREQMIALQTHQFSTLASWVRSLVLCHAVFSSGMLDASEVPFLPIADPKKPVDTPVYSQRRTEIPFVDQPHFHPQQVENRWDIGEMSDEEQLYLELVNRARANPVVEGDWLVNLDDKDVLSNLSFFNVDLDRVLNDPDYGFYQLLPAQPLAPNGKLNLAARMHAQDMFDNTYQAHVGTDGSTAGDRISLVGYSWGAYSENVFAQADSVVHGHAGFQIDWGFGPGGIQNPPGHRIQIHNGDYREFGVGVINGNQPNAFPESNESKFRDVGPQVVAQLVAREFIDVPFITGVAYYDFNRNAFYDLGEGLGGIKVTVPGSLYHAVTASSGGYAIPVDTNGNYSIGMEGVGLPSLTSSVVVANRTNVKKDYIVDYAPSVTGPLKPVPGLPATYQVNRLPLAEKYQIERNISAPFTATEGGEQGMDEFNYVGIGSYTVLQSVITHAGTHAFRLAHNAPIGDEFLEWNRNFVVSPDASITFQSRLGSAFENETASFQVSPNDGKNWHSLWTQVGTSLNSNPVLAPSERAFSPRVIDLSDFEGQTIRVRWVFEFTRGRVWVGSDEFQGTGWYIDSISATGLKSLESTVFPEQPGNSFTFTPESTEPFTLRGRAFIKGEWRPWGDRTAVGDSSSQLGARILGVSQSGSLMTVQLEIPGGNGSAVFESASALSGPWLPAVPVSVDPGQQQNVLHITLEIGTDANRFFRIHTE